jgi:hypothetical protein
VKPPEGLQLDLACALARIDQIQEAADEGLRELLITRLSYDSNRLRKYLTDDTVEWAAQQ